MAEIKAQFPDAVWDGMTPNTWRKTRHDSVEPTQDDWDQIASELIATQVVVSALGVTVATVPAIPTGEGDYKLHVDEDGLPSWVALT